MSDTFIQTDEQPEAELFGGSTPQEPAAETPETETKPKRRVRRQRATTPRATEQLYSVADIAKIIEFTVIFDETEQAFRDRYVSAFGFSDTDVDGLRAATTLSSFPTDIAGFRLFASLAYDALDGKLGDFTRVIAIVGEYGRADDDELKSAITFAGAALPGGAGVEYKRGVAAADVVQSLSTVLTTLNDGERADVRNFLDWVGSLVATWPGE